MRRRRNGDKHTTFARIGAGVLALAFTLSPPLHAEPNAGLAEQTQIAFSIAAQPLSSALMQLGQQANVQILTASDTLAGLPCAGAHGRLSIQQALTQLLAGTNLTFETFDAQTVIVRERGFVPGVSYESALTGAVPSVPIVTSLATMSVAGTTLGDVGFKADKTRAATRSETALTDVPQSVSVVTRDLIDAQQAVTVADIVRNVAGVNYVDGFGGPPLFRIRGFNVGNGLTDGLPNGVARIEDLPPLIGVERVEVLKGPEAILGESSVDNNFGGSVNVVLKRPQADPVHELSFSFARYDGARLGIDLAWPLGATSAWTYRWVASGNDTGRSPQGYRGQRSVYLAPSLAWQGATTQLIFGAEYIDNRIPVADHSVLLGDSLETSTPLDVLPGNANDHAAFRTTRGYYSLTHQLDGDWQITSRGQYVQQRSSGADWSFLDTQLTGYANAQAQAYHYADAFYTMQNDIGGSIEQGWLTHHFLFGIDYARTREGNATDPGSLVVSRPIEVDLLSNFSLPSARLQTQTTQEATQSLGGAWSNNTGLFLQDQLALGSQWDVLAALRRTSYQLTSHDLLGRQQDLHKSQWIPKLGVVYKPWRDVSFYASSATGFQTDSLVGQDGQPLPPSVSRQIEVGSKIELFDQRARLTTAVYRIKLDHSVDLVSPTPPFFAVPGPGQTNRGFEAELSGEVARGLDISTSVTVATIHNDDGTPATASPRRQGSLWLSYHFQREALQGWGVAGGVFARSRILAQRSEGGGYVSVPGQASAEINVSYDASQWRATLGVKNLFARTLYAFDVDQTFVPVREGRVVMFSGSYDF